MDVIIEAFSQLMSRSAIAGGASVMAIGAVVFWWWLRVHRAQVDRSKASLAILISGSRGKSSTVRLLHATLTAAGYRTYGKTTGTAAVELPIAGPERATVRFGQISMIEMQESIHRAMNGNPPAEALVLECMAVKPELISLVSQRMVEPNIVIITNVMLDHLEEEGHNLEQIATSLGEAITPGSLVVTGEQRTGPLSVLMNLAHRRGATLIDVHAEEVPDSVRARLIGVHPQNIALTLAVTRSLGIPDVQAVDGMANATHEPGSQDVWLRSLSDMQITFIDLGAINDPESLLSALRQDARLSTEAGMRIGLLIGRWDRPLRAMEFAGLLSPKLFDGLIVTGGPVHAIRNVLIGGGWSADRIQVAVHLTGSMLMWRRRLVGLARRIDPNVRQISVIALENIHDRGADRLRDYCSQGERAGPS